jgi:outer membrane protein assembly factor BamC
VKRFLTYLVLGSGLAVMSGCSTLDSWMSGDKVDYRSQGAQTAGLDVPPDLTQLQRDSRPATGAVVSAAALQGRTDTAGAASSSGLNDNSSPKVAVQSLGKVRIERHGQQRWLSTPQSPEQVWPQLQAFWKERKFVLAVNQAEAGVMETEWTANLDAAPKEGLRGALNRVLGSLASSGERDKFRLRIERAPQGGSEVYLTHRGLVEVFSNEQKDATSWQPRPADPQIEAQMLSQLMAKLAGVSEDSAKAAVEQAADVPARARPLSEASKASLQVDDAFEGAWRRVGAALDRGGFTVEDQDRDQGLYFVRYVDSQAAPEKKPGLLSRLFNRGQKEAQTQQRYRVWVQAAGAASSKVSVLNAQGALDGTPTGQRIAALLLDDLK